MILVSVAAFALMELVSYSLHRWVMHGRGMALHASHHAPPTGRFERNDAYPAIFGAVGAGLFALAAWGPLPGWVWWAAAGITAYGVAYLLVHEVFIHRRISLPVPDNRYFRWLRTAHRAHHLDGGEPYGMLLPVLSSSRREATRAAQSRDGDDVLVRASTRSTRQRL